MASILHNHWTQPITPSCPSPAHLRVKFEDGGAQWPHRGGGKGAQADRVCRVAVKHARAVGRWAA